MSDRSGFVYFVLFCGYSGEFALTWLRISEAEGRRFLASEPENSRPAGGEDLTEVGERRKDDGGRDSHLGNCIANEMIDGKPQGRYECVGERFFGRRASVPVALCSRGRASLLLRMMPAHGGNRGQPVLAARWPANLNCRRSGPANRCVHADPVPSGLGTRGLLLLLRRASARAVASACGSLHLRLAGDLGCRPLVGDSVGPGGPGVLHLDEWRRTGGSLADLLLPELWRTCARSTGLIRRVTFLI